jgi:hypothetical protein
MNYCLFKRIWIRHSKVGFPKLFLIEKKGISEKYLLEGRGVTKCKTLKQPFWEKGNPWRRKIEEKQVGAELCQAQLGLDIEVIFHVPLN